MTRKVAERTRLDWPPIIDQAAARRTGKTSAATAYIKQPSTLMWAGWVPDG